MSTQIGPGLRDYLGPLRGRAARARTARARCWSCRATAAPSRPPRRRRTAISTVGSVLTGGVVGAVALGEQLGHRNIISTDVGGTTFLVGPGRRRRAGPRRPPRSSTTTRSTCRRSGCTPSAPAAARSPGWTPAATCGSARTAPQAVPGPACYGQGGTEPTNTDANLVLGILPERGLLGGRKPLSTRAGPARPSAPDRRAARPVRRGRRGRDLRGAERADRRPAPQGRRRGRATTRATSSLYAFGGAGPAHCAALRRRGRASREVVVPLGPVASAFSAYGLASSDIVLAARAVRPVGRCRSTRPGAETQLRRSSRPRSASGLDRQGVTFDDGRARTARSTCATRCSSPRSPTPVPDGPLDEAAVEPGRAQRFEEQLRRALRRGHRLPRGRHPGHHLPGPRHRRPAVLARSCPNSERRGRRGPRRRAGRQPSGLPRRRRRLRRHRRLRLRAAARRPRPRRARPIIEVPTTTVVVPAGRTGTRRPPRQPRPSSHQ